MTIALTVRTLCYSNIMEFHFICISRGTFSWKLSHIHVKPSKGRAGYISRARVMIPRGVSRNYKRRIGRHRRGGRWPLPTKSVHMQCAVPEQGPGFVCHCLSHCSCPASLAFIIHTRAFCHNGCTRSHRNFPSQNVRPYFSCMAISSSSLHSPTSSCQASRCNSIVLQDGWSPLMIALDEGHVDVVMTLIEAGADVNQTDKVSIM